MAIKSSSGESVSPEDIGYITRREALKIKTELSKTK